MMGHYFEYFFGILKALKKKKPYWIIVVVRVEYRFN